jgi:hypothetical protein
MSSESNKRHDSGEASAFGGVLALGAGVLLMSIMAATPVLPGADADCNLTIGPAQVVAGGEAVEVRAVPSEALEEAHEVAFPAESGLTGRVVDHDPLTLLVDPSGAEPGTWDVVVRDSQGATCAGTLTVDS